MVNLLDVNSWLDVTIPGSDRPVDLHRLHADPLGQASVSLVRFPPGWSRPEPGHYAAAEEFVVLEGSITVGGHYVAGDYAYIPPRTLRADSRSDEGALVLAWFSAFPAWTLGEAEVAPPGPQVAGRPSGTMRSAAAEVPGGYAVLDAVPAPRDVDADLYCAATATWEWLPAGAIAEMASSRVQVRTWG